MGNACASCAGVGPRASLDVLAWFQVLDSHGFRFAHEPCSSRRETTRDADLVQCTPHGFTVCVSLVDAGGPAAGQREIDAMHIEQGRLAARIEGDFVVFLIGARINRFRDVRAWLPVVRAMPKMLAELDRRPELGLLHSWSAQRGLREALLIQYWRSYEHLHAYARARESEHLPAWAAYNRAIKDNDAVGIWHETYLVPAGQYEAIYGNMPRYGLAQAGELLDARGASTSSLGRLGRSDGEDQPLDPDGRPREVA